MCERTYSIQCRKKVEFKAARGLTLWKHLYINRPRVRYNGLYFLRIAYCKKPERSMFTDLPAGAILEVAAQLTLHLALTGLLHRLFISDH